MISAKLFVTTIFLTTVLATSSVYIPVAAAVSPSPSTAYTFPSAPPTYTGSAAPFLSSPVTVSLSAGAPAPGSPATLNPSALPSTKALDPNPKPYVPASDPPTSSSIPPAVSCRTGGGGGSGCSPVSVGPGGTKTNGLAMNAVDTAPFVVEPPDQGLCAGGGYVMELMNQGEMQVFSSGNLAPASGVIYLDTLMGLNTFPNGGWSSGGDPMCQYDPANGGHWIITEIVSASNETSGGPFSGCFFAVPDTCYEGIAVSASSDPIGTYRTYFLDANTVNGDPGSDANAAPVAGVLLNDYAKTALTRDAFLLFYDEFNLYGNFNGVQEFAFGKTGLETGGPVTVAYENMGTAPNLSPIPANGMYQPVALPSSAFYQVIPAQTTDPSQYDNANGGTGFMIGTLDFFGNGDNRTAVFDWTDLSALNTPGCGACSGIAFGGQLLTGVVTYQDEGAPCLAEDYYTTSTFCGLGTQKAGPIPLGNFCSAVGDGEPVQGCPEGGIASNGDGATQAFYAGGTIYTAVSTIVLQTYTRASPETHLGATYWGVKVTNGDAGVTFAIASQGYISAAHEDIEFPAMAASGGTVLVSFTLSGVDYYPSSAYIVLGANNVIHIAALGQAPEDGFSEYQFYGTSLSYLYRPRWGDYGQAVFDPGTGRFVFASEYIQSPNCIGSAFQNDPTCGGTRSPYANWGSSINSLPS
ncbi:MAG: hypothetical protein JRN57_04030 [Nitrososphaerota archaeon]|nr:hypothetical protein [Nitrososphaerota archaeon]